MAESEKVVEIEEEEQLDYLAQMVVECYREASAHRSSTRVMGKTIDQWLRLLYNAYHKIHEQEELEQQEGMSTYLGLVQIKVHAVTNYLVSKYVSDNNRAPFGLLPTPIVELPKDGEEEAYRTMVYAILKRLNEEGLEWDNVFKNGALHPSVVKYVEKKAKESVQIRIQEEKKIAERGNKDMEQLIQDQLIDAQYMQAIKDMLLDLGLYPAGILSYEHTPVTVKKWNGNDFTTEERVEPKFRRVNPMNCYFAPDATNAQDGSYFIELIERTKEELSQLAKESKYGFIEDSVEQVIDNWNENWLNSEEQQVQGTHTRQTITVIKCQMKVSGNDLCEYGMDIKEEDLNKYFMADIEVADHLVIRCRFVHSPKGERTYFSASYKTLAGEPYGISVAMMVYDRQLVVNRLQYYMLANVAPSSSPMVEVNANHIENPEEVNFAPFSIIYTKPTKQITGQGIFQHQIRPTYQGTMQLLQIQMRQADEECGIPAFMSGNGSTGAAGRTLGGLALMTDNAIAGLLDCALNIDMFVIKPLITLMYMRNLMQKKIVLRHDANVVPTGLKAMNAQVEQAKKLAGLIPMTRELAAQGQIPPDMLTDQIRQFYESQGINMDGYIPSAGVESEMTNIINSAPPQVSLDGRSTSQMGNLGE